MTTFLTPKGEKHNRKERNDRKIMNNQELATYLGVHYNTITRYRSKYGLLDEDLHYADRVIDFVLHIKSIKLVDAAHGRRK